jgi:hypothetical protein
MRAVLPPPRKGAREALTNVYSSAKSIWITDLGWATGTEAELKSLEEHHPAERKNFVTEGEQASLLSSSFEMIENHSTEWEIKSLIWYAYRDDNSEVAWQNHAGLRS